MKRFSEWIKNRSLLESKSGRYRSSASDLTNLSIGKLGPYATFGGAERPGVVKTAVGSIIDGIGDRMRKLMGRVDPASRIEDLDFDFLKNQDTVSAELPLQVPIIKNDNIDLSNFVYKGEQATFIHIIKFLNSPQIFAQKVNLDGQPDDSRFDLFQDQQAQNNKFATNRDLAINFTIALCKIKLYYNLVEKFEDIENTYDIQNPKVLKLNYPKYDNVTALRVLFKYEKKKTGSDDFRGTIG